MLTNETLGIIMHPVTCSLGAKENGFCRCHISNAAYLCVKLSGSLVKEMLVTYRLEGKCGGEWGD